MNTTTTTITPSRPVSLPTELYDLIFSQLNQSTLTACTRVSSTWHKLCTPHLWKTVSIFDGEQLERFMVKESQLALCRNAIHVRDLALKYTSVYNVFSPFDDGSRSILTVNNHIPQCINIQRLYLLRYEEPQRGSDGHWVPDRSLLNSNDPAFEIAVAALISQNPGLKELVIQIAMPHETLPLLIRGLPNLRELLFLNPHASFDPTDVNVLLQYLSQNTHQVHMRIKFLRMAGEQQQQHLHGSGHLQNTESSLAAGDYLLLLPYLNTYRKLEPLLIPGIDWICHPHIRRELSRLDVRLKTLQASMMQDVSSDAKIADRIRLSEHWTSMDLFGCFYFGTLAVAALVDHCEHLESLDLTGCNISSAETQSILDRAVCLKTVSGLTISADDLIALKWGSLLLEQFAGKIVVPQPPVNVGKKEVGSLKHLAADAASRSVQRRVYRKLAEQTALKVLQLGHENSDLEQSWCLEMTLASGLDELSGLEKMEHLSIMGDMDQRIGVAELEWMSKTWPNLRQVTGLFKSFSNKPLPGVCEWLRDNRDGWVPQDERECFRETLFRMTANPIRWYYTVAVRRVTGTLDEFRQARAASRVPDDL